MILDLERDVIPDSLQAQVCIVGAGAVGLSMAVALARLGVDVLLLEAGGAQLESANQAMHEGESTGHPFESVDVGRYRVLGGSTSFWGGQVIAFDDFVIGERPWVGHSAWPLSAADLQRYIGLAYDSLGLGAAVEQDAEVWRRLKLAPPALGPEVDLLLTRWVPVRNLARHHAREIRANGRLRVLLHANVVALGLVPARDRVSHLVVRTRSGKSLQVSGGQVVLANGTLEMARLLMHPLADGSVAPWASSPWLGRPLIDHLDCTAAQLRLKDVARFHQLFDNIFLDGLKYFPRMRLPVAVQREQGLVDCGANFLYRTRFTEHIDVLKMFARSLREGGMAGSLWQVPGHLAAVLGTALPLAVRYFRDRRSFKPANAEVSLALYCEQLPNSHSKLTLGSDQDAVGLRRLRVNWDIDGRELRTMKVFAQRIAQTLARNGLAEAVIDPLLLDESPDFLRNIHDAVHQMGTARMGADAASGFVDADMAVFGMANLCLGGAAVFPSSGFANPTLTAVALGLRLADHLATLSRG